MRGETFVTRKITRAETRIALGLERRLYLGTLCSLRDWSHARDYVEAMYLMLLRDERGAWRRQRGVQGGRLRRSAGCGPRRPPVLSPDVSRQPAR